MKILITPSSFGQCGDEPLRLLKDNSFLAVLNPYGRKLTEEEVVLLGYDCTGIVAGVEPLTKKVIDAMPKLACISRVGIGTDNIDLIYAKHKGIVVRNTPDGPTRAVAELTLALTMALLRKIPQADKNIRKGNWKKEIGTLLVNKRIGIYGLGRIGKLTATLFLALGNDVLAFDPVKDDEWLKNHPVKMVGRETLFLRSDIITLHTPKPDSDQPQIGKPLLRLMKESAFLINVSRGGVVDEPYLFKILKSHKIAGAALDVFEAEPYTGSFITLENTVLTPHLGSYAREGKLKMEISAVNNLISVLSKKC